MEIINIITGIVFTFFIPGFVVVETFFKSLPRIAKLPLYILLSLLLSTYCIYFLSLAVGFNRFAILAVFAFFAFCFALVLRKKYQIDFGFFKEHIVVFVFALLTFALFLASLLPGIFTLHNGYIVMSAENWQDTAMHMSIIENLTQGNFPPQTPFFSGVPLTYYYFADFHAAIIEKLVGRFFPEVLVLVNPFFIAFFILAVYALAFVMTKSRRVSLLASFLAAFYGNFMSLKFFQDVINGGRPLDLIAAKGYTIDFGGILTISPMADYFLQNRPMMIGLPVFAVIMMLSYLGFKHRDYKLFLLTGLILSLMTKFQLFVVVASGFVVFSGIILKPKFFIKALIFLGLGLIPGILLTLFSQAGNSSLLDLFKNSLKLMPFSQDKTWDWHILFLAGNFGIHIFLIVLTVIFLVLKKLKLNREIVFLSLLAITLFGFPYLIRFTIYDGDMFKFFYLAIIPLSILAALPLNKIFLKNKLTKVLIILFLAFSSLTCFLNLGWSALNKNEAYSLPEYKAGLWMRENTLQNTVFAQLPTVHSAVSDIAGRPRIISYITWPYSHGFNTGEDNVFSRRDDMEILYKTSDQELIKTILQKYDIHYIYYGQEERNFAPLAENSFDSTSYLKKIYNSEGIAIFQFIDI